MDKPKSMTVLEEIISETAEELYKQWVQALPESERNEETLSNIKSNSSNTAVFVIKVFMDKFNKAAEELKPKD